VLSRQRLGHLLVATGRKEEAAAEYRTAIALIQDLVDGNPAVPAFRSLQASIRSDLGYLLLQFGKPEAAEAECRDSRTISQEIAKNNANVWVFDAYLYMALNNLGDVLRARGRATEAKDCYEQAIALIDRSQFHEKSHSTDMDIGTAFASWRRGLALLDLGDPAGAATDVRRALALCEGLEPLPNHLYETACGHAALAGLAGRPGSGVSAAEGEKAAERAMECLGRTVAKGYRNTNQIRIESAFDSIRGRADFQKLIAELNPKAQPSQELAPMPREKK
jgi:tetratricopeptide (TPR) repeat protein